MEAICLKCALCCDGTIFGDLKLSDADRARLASTPLSTKTLQLPQPCPALCGKACTIYTRRPAYCRRFECLLLKRLNEGTISKSEALSTIRSARRKAAKVRRLLAGIQNTSRTTGEPFALAAEFRRVSQRMMTGHPAPEEVLLFGELTVAFQELNSALAENFYR